MSRRNDAILYAIFTLILFVGIPYYILTVQPGLIVRVSEYGVDLRNLLTPFIYLGVVLAALTLGIGFTEPRQYINLVLRLVSVGLGLIFILLFVGLGNIAGLGLESVTFTRDNTQATVAIDMRLLIYLTIIVTVVKLFEVVFSFREARAELSIDIPKTLP